MSERPSSPGGIPGAPFDFKAMFEAMEFARRSWSTSFSMPEALTPTVDPAELDKRIADLKTVEQWLVLNLNLLKGSIQTLEMQRAALGSLQSFGDAARAATQAGASTAAPDAQSSSTASAAAQSNPQDAGALPGLDPAGWRQALTTQFQKVAESALAGTSASPPAASGAGQRASSAGSRGTSAAKKRATPRAKTRAAPRAAGSRSRSGQVDEP